MPSAKRAPYIYMVLAAIFIGSVGTGIYGAVFNNYLEATHHLKAADRGFLELPRELPGVISMFAVGMLFMLSEVRISALAMLLCFAGTITMAIPALSGFWLLIAWITVASLGQHIIMAVTDAIVIHTALPENRAMRLGQMRALGTAAGLVAALFVWIKWKYNGSYAVDFVVSALLCLVAAVMFARVRNSEFPERKSWRDSFFLKRAYFKYYLLETLFGARKQVFMTFAFWLMVSTMGLSPAYIGKTLLAAGLLGLVFQPFIGRMIQVFGEAKVLVVDCVVLLGVCLAYAYAPEALPPGAALAVVTVCFVLDSLLFADGAARAHYLSRICERKEDVTPSLYTGMAINHVVSIVCAIAGGWLWTSSGSHKSVFLFAAGLCVVSGIVSSTIPRAPGKAEQAGSQSPA